MKLFGIASICIFIGIFVQGCQNDEPQSVSPEDVEEVVKDNTAFALDLYQQFSSKDGNQFYSPYSISCCLAMAYAGARSNTEKQMANALHFSLDQDNLHPALAALQAQLLEVPGFSLEAELLGLPEGSDIKLSIANSFWVQKNYKLLKEYLSLTNKHYGASVTPVNFRGQPEDVVNKINKWVENRTEDKIRDILSVEDIHPDTLLMLVNTMHFKGTWKDQFHPIPQNSTGSPFYISPGRTIQIPIMSKRIYGVMYAEGDELQVLELPYIGDTISMLILLPKKIDGLESLEKSLSIESLDLWRRKLKDFPVDVYIPKFEITCTYDLIPAFKQMGMIDAFYPGTADFSGMTGHKGLYVDLIRHKAKVSVDEKGTEASAATVLTGSASIVKIPVFRADHPFLFLIQDNQTGSILFMGRLVDPSKTIQ